MMKRWGEGVCRESRDQIGGMILSSALRCSLTTGGGAILSVACQCRGVCVVLVLRIGRSRRVGRVQTHLNYQSPQPY